MAMTCKEVRKLHPALDAAAHAHLTGCADCREFARSWDLLQDYLELSPSESFFRTIRRKLAPPLLRFAAPVAAAAAVLLLTVVLIRPPSTLLVPADTVTDDERELADNLDLLENYEILRTLEFVGSVEEERK